MRLFLWNVSSQDPKDPNFVAHYLDFGNNFVAHYLDFGDNSTHQHSMVFFYGFGQLFTQQPRIIWILQAQT